MRLVSAAGCFVVLAASLFAQNDRGTITGEVKDPAGSVVPNATVVAANMGTGAESKSTTTSTGNYTIPSLTAGMYTLTVEAPGFKRFRQQNIEVQVAVTNRIDVVSRSRRNNRYRHGYRGSGAVEDRVRRTEHDHSDRPDQRIAVELRRRRRQYRHHAQPVCVQHALARCNRQRLGLGDHQRLATGNLPRTGGRSGFDQPERCQLDIDGLACLGRFHRGILAADQQFRRGVQPGGQRFL